MKSDTEILQTDTLTETKRGGWLRRFYAKADKGLLILILLFVLTLPLFTPRIYASDEIKYFSYLHSIFFDHDVDFTNEYTHFYQTNPRKYEDFRQSVLEKRNEKNLPPNEGPIGSALMWSPFYLAAHGAAYLGQAIGLKSFKPDGYSTPYTFAVSLASLLYGFLGLVLCYKLVSKFVPRFYAALATAAVWLASPVIFYMSLTPPMSHANSLFMISLWLYIWYSTRRWRYDEQGNFIPGQRSGSKWLLLGVLGGLMTMVREQDGTVLIIVALESLYLYYQFWKKSKLSNKYQVSSNKSELGSIKSESFPDNRQPTTDNPSPNSQRATRNFLILFSGNLQLLIGLVLAIIPQLLVYTALNGHPGPSKIVSDKLGFFNPEVLVRFVRLMFDLDYGMFFWSPILLPAALGLVLMLRERRLRLLAVVLLAAYFCELYISASFQTWTMRGSFGSRRLVGISPAFIAGLAYLAYYLAELKKGWHLRQRWLVAVAVLFIVWNFGVIIQFSAIRTPDERQKLDFPRTVADQFTAVPSKIVTIAQKFLTDRSSFYKQG